jgi:hypothetical protein
MNSVPNSIAFQTLTKKPFYLRTMWQMKQLLSKLTKRLSKFKAKFNFSQNERRSLGIPCRKKSQNVTWRK